MADRIKVDYKNGNTVEWECAEDSASVTGNNNFVWCGVNVTESGWGCISLDHIKRICINGKKIYEA